MSSPASEAFLSYRAETEPCMAVPHLEMPTAGQNVHEAYMWMWIGYSWQYVSPGHGAETHALQKGDKRGGKPV